MSKIKNFVALVCMLSVANAWGAGFFDDFDRPNGDVGNGWATQTDGTITVQIVDNEVLIAGTQATDWARCGISRPVVDETSVSCDFLGGDNFNFHIRIDDADTSAFLEIYTWGGPLIHANSEDGSWPGWTDITGSNIVAGQYNNVMLMQDGTEFTVILNGAAVGTLTNAGLTRIGEVLISSDAAAGTTGSLHIDNVRLWGPLIVPETSVAPVIDGALDDVWQGASEESLLITDIINATSAVPEDASDLSGTFKVMYDDDNFYFLIEVQDSILDYQFSDWQGDSVELFFDGDNSKGSTYDGVNDNQIRINIDDVELGDVGKTLPIDGTVFKVLLTDVGYNIEAAFPLAALQIVPENVFGFEVQLNDNDGGGGRETLIRWFSNDNDSWRDASLFGEAILVPTPEPEPVDPGSDGLVAFYPLENDVLDASGNGNDGTIVGNPTWIPGVSGTALEFHGLGAAGGGGDYIDCGSGASLDVTGPISLALWIRPDAEDPEGQGTTTAPMAKAMSGMSPSWSYQVRYGWNSPQPYMAFTFNTSPRAWAYVGQNLVQGEWAHIACAHDGTTLKCYLNGAQTDSTPMGQITSSPAPVLIGSDGWGCDWIGGIDEVAIYDRGLSDGEILYLAGYRVNLLQNPSFEEDEAILDDPDWAQWCTWNPAEGAGSNAMIVDTDSLDGARSLRIEPKGTENWHFIVLYLPIMVNMDKNYEVSFWAKAEEPRPLTVQLKATDNSINAWGATDFELTTEWAEYSYTSEVLIDNVKIEICCSGTEVPFWLDLVSICEGK